MGHVLRTFIGAAVVLSTAGISFGDATIGSLNTAGFSASAGHDFLGEAFVAPAGETGLVSGTLMLRNGTAGTVNGTLSIREFDSTTANPSAGAFGATLASQAFSLAPGGPIAVSRTFNVPVIAGAEYALVADWGTGNGAVGGGYFNSGYTPAGFTIFAGAAGEPVLFTGFDMAFEATFGAIPEPGTVAVLAPAAVLALSRHQRRRAIR